MLTRHGLVAMGTLLLLACGGSVETDAGQPPMDAGPRADAATADAAASDDAATAPDSGTNPADAGTQEDGGSPVEDDAGTIADAGDQCTMCIGETLRWELDGGFRAYQSANEVQDCRVYEHTRMPFVGGTATSCTNTVPCEGDAITIGDLTAALAHPDVVAAFDAAPILYGRDTRPVDGVIFQITLGGRTVSVGSECTGGGGPPCEAIPPGVAALRALLTSLEGERLAEEDCASTFP